LFLETLRETGEMYGNLLRKMPTIENGELNELNKPFCSTKTINYFDAYVYNGMRR